MKDLELIHNNRPGLSANASSRFAVAFIFLGFLPKNRMSGTG
jgi:hypothetical protein